MALITVVSWRLEAQFTYFFKSFMCLSNKRDKNNKQNIK